MSVDKTADDSAHDKPLAKRPTMPRVGAPLGNRNRMQSGTRSFILGRWPKGGSYIAKVVGVLRSELEREVLAQKGEIEFREQALIKSICRHEGLSLLWMKWLREKSAELSIERKILITQEIGRSTDRRDAAMKKLGIGAKHSSTPANAWDQLILPPIDLDPVGMPDGPSKPNGATERVAE